MCVNKPSSTWPSSRCWIVSGEQPRSDESMCLSFHLSWRPRHEPSSHSNRWWWLCRHIASTKRSPCDRWESIITTDELSDNSARLQGLTLLHCSVWRSQILMVLSRRPDTILLSSYWRQYTPLEFSERQLIRCKLWLPERQLFSIVSMS